MITPSFGLTATERVLPRLALDWTTGLVQSGVDVTRAGEATFVGSNGLIQSATADTQRIDYSTGTAGLLVEESRTNLCYPSRLPTTTTQTTIGVVQVNGDAQVESGFEGVDGTNGAFSVTGANQSGNSNGADNIRILNVITGAATYTVSFWIKALVAPTTVTIRDAQTATTESFVTTDDWVRVSRTVTTTAGGNIIIYHTTGASFLMDGLQVEIGAFPTSYIPTVASQVTRNADVATMTGTNFSDWFNASEGTFVSEASFYNFINTPIVFSVSDGTDATNLIQNNTSGTGVVRYRVAISGSNVVNNLSTGVTATVNTPFKISSAYKQDSFAAACNGATAVTDDLGNLPVPTQVRFMQTGSGGTTASGHLSYFAYYSQRLTNAEVRAFSK
jgi:hypothetical protein